MKLRELRVLVRSIILESSVPSMELLAKKLLAGDGSVWEPFLDACEENGEREFLYWLEDYDLTDLFWIFESLRKIANFEPIHYMNSPVRGVVELKGSIRPEEARNQFIIQIDSMDPNVAGDLWIVSFGDYTYYFNFQGQGPGRQNGVDMLAYDEQRSYYDGAGTMEGLNNNSRYAAHALGLFLKEREQIVPEYRRALPALRDFVELKKNHATRRARNLKDQEEPGEKLMSMVHSTIDKGTRE